MPWSSKNPQQSAKLEKERKFSEFMLRPANLGPKRHFPSSGIGNVLATSKDSKTPNTPQNTPRRRLFKMPAMRRFFRLGWGTFSALMIFYFLIGVFKIIEKYL